MNKLQRLLKKRAELAERAKAMQDAADAESRELSDDEATEVDALLGQVEDVNTEIADVRPPMRGG